MGTDIGVEDESDTVQMLVRWCREMRAEQPVHFDESAGVWHVFRYDDVKLALSRPESFSSEFPPELKPSWPGADVLDAGNFAIMDPPRHGVLRSLVSRAFTPAAVAAMEPLVRSVATSALDAADRLGGVVDFVRDVALPVPANVIADVLGFGTHDHALLTRWMNANLAHEVRGVHDTGVETLGYQQAVLEMSDYLLRQLRRRPPGGRDDLLGALSRAEVDEHRLTEREIVSTGLLLAGGGFVTTMSLLSSLVLCGATHPGLWSRLRADRALVPGALEEVLRVRPPFSRVARRTTADVELGGVPIPANSVVVPWITSANRDDAYFLDPDRVVVERRPNPHLSFGRGVHFCLGATLARLEGVVVANLLLDRYVSIEIGDDALANFDPAAGVLALSALPVHLRPDS